MAVIWYRSSLEAPDPQTSGDIISDESIPVIDLRVCLPSSDEPGFTWITERFTPDRTDRSSLMALLVSAWGRGLMDMIGADSKHIPVLEHCFLDDGGIAYLDFNGQFMNTLPLSTTSEMQILASLFQTVQGAIHSVRRIEVLRDGIPVHTWGGHLFIDFSCNPLLAEKA